MNKLPWRPWHKVVEVRDDLKSGELTLAIFAADLYDVVMDTARPVYREPREFFALTYPTFALRELARDVAARLAGKSDKAVRQLELTHGGGKTHTLITLYHLVNDPDTLPRLPAVEEFLEHIGHAPPKSRVAALSFDKLDVEKGMEARSPPGARRWLRQPWSVLAYQLAGDDGLRHLHPDGRPEERDSAPAEPLLADLLARPGREGLSTLVLIDEVLMYARGKADADPGGRAKLVNFFQYLTQAATKVDRCAVVASLLATDPKKNDPLGKEIAHELAAIFRREREEGVQPVGKHEVAEVLRRRFFKPDTIRDREAFRPHVLAALKGVADLDEPTRKDARNAEARFLESYPFHPELTELFYGKWTDMESFQRTRGVLRTFALAIRDSLNWDDSPLIGANVFLGAPDRPGLPEAARELTTVASTEEYEGKRQEWSAILEGELAKARAIQAEATGLKFREVEQAVLATFLHSQPAGKKALTRDLLVLLGPTRPDRIELEKALRRWTEVSWFLDEAAIGDVDGGPGGPRPLPRSWRLGSRPNLRQMHHDACGHVPPDLVDAKLGEEIGRLKSLTAGASAAGAKVHNLPERPRDVPDDGDFHYAVLGPRAASESGKPGAEARRFLDETTGPDRPRAQNRNALVLAVPSRDGLEAARAAIRDYLGWEEVRSQLREQEVDPIRSETLAANLEAARRKVPAALEQAYCIVVTVSDRNEAQAFKLTPGGQPLFTLIKSDGRSRIQETAISAEALLPGGPYDLWESGEAACPVRDLVCAFARFPRLPKMLSWRAILDTLLLGCREGQLVLRSARPDKSIRTCWRQLCEDVDLKDPTLEVVLPEAADLAEVPPGLLAPGVLPGLWAGAELRVADLYAYFAGGKTIQVKKEGYDEAVTIPRADRAVVDAAVGAAVKGGGLWLTSGTASVLGEEVPAGLIADGATLQAPPQPIPATDVLPANLPEAWAGGVATGQGIAAALSRKAGKPLPWSSARDAIDGACRARMLERTADSSAWPCEYSAAGQVKLNAPSAPQPQTQTPPAVTHLPGVLAAEADLQPNEFQDLADQIGDLARLAVGLDPRFRVRIEIGGRTRPPAETVARLNEKLQEICPRLKLE